MQRSLITLALIGPRRLPLGLQGNRIKFSRDAIHNSIINPRESWDGSLCSPLLNEQLCVRILRSGLQVRSPIAGIGEKRKKKNERKGKGEKEKKKKGGRRNARMHGETMDRKNPRNIRTSVLLHHFKGI